MRDSQTEDARKRIKLRHERWCNRHIDLLPQRLAQIGERISPGRDLREHGFLETQGGKEEKSQLFAPNLYIVASPSGRVIAYE